VIDIPTSRAHRLRVEAAILARKRLSKTVIALSSAQRRWYNQYAGADAPVTVLPNGVVEPQLSRDRTSIRAELGVPEDALLAVCVSLMRPEKGHTHLLEAIRQLPDDLSLVVAMAGDGPLLASIRSTVDSDPVLPQRARVLGFRRDVADLIAASDFVVQPSLEDALPTALISALAAARPIVATHVGGIPDIVGPGCGLLVEAGRPAALSAGIAEMAATIRGDAGAVEAMHRATRERYESRFSADIWATNLRAVYGQTIGARQIANVSAGTPVRRPRRITLVEFPPSGGLFQFSLQLGEALARAGDDVELVTGPSPELTSREPGCRIRSILPTWHPTAGADTAEWWRRARRGVRAGQLTAAWTILLAYLLATRPDIVVWSAWRFPIDGWGVRVVRKALPNAVLVLVAHEPRPLVEQPGQDGMYKACGVTNRALAKAYADLDVAFVLGESAKQILTETWPISAPVHVIPHGDEALFDSTDIPGAETTGPVALSFGTITAYKGIDTLCQAWPTVRAHVPDAELVIAGALSADVDESALRSQVASLVGVSLHTGYVPVQDVPSYFARARCVVLPYKRASQSGVAHLAHTLARPVVATCVGDIPSVVRDGVSGLLVAPDHPDALADVLVRLLTDPESAREMGDAGARALATGASWDQVAARLVQGLDSLRRDDTRGTITVSEPGGDDSDAMSL
jgi:glycosyltransferase involved in cell wall biosynthesis